jgi:hypothetical protein
VPVLAAEIGGEVEMVLRVILSSVLGLAATLGLASPAAAGDMPKEGTCHFTSTLKGSATLNMIGTLQDGGNGLEVFDETGAVVIDCGQGQLPPSTQHCFGTGEMHKGFWYRTGYCITTEQDRDTVAWKLIFEGQDKYSFQSSGTQDALISSGKYDGMTAAGKLSCTNGMRSGAADLTESCEGDFSYKRK